MSTISGTTITSGVVIGTSGNYASPLTIASDGAIEVMTGNDALYGPVTQAWTVANYGTVAGLMGNNGVHLQAGGTVDNLGPAARIFGELSGVLIEGSAGTVGNTGTIIGANTNGVALLAGGSVTNSGTGLIYGHGGVYITGAAGTVSNAGTIDGTVGYGVLLAAGSTVVNSGTILSDASFYTVHMGSGYLTNSQSGYVGSGGIEFLGVGTMVNDGRIVDSFGVGINLQAGGTVIDSGTIVGSGTAVYFGGIGTNLLGLEIGYSLSGGVAGNAGATNTVELLGAAGAVMADYNGLGLTNFGTIAFGAASGNSEIWQITNDATLPGTIAGFVAVQDTIDVTGLVGGTVGNGGTFNGSHQLVIGNGTDTVTLQLDPGEDYTGLSWAASPDGGSGTDVTPVCYCRGTHILTPSGEVAIEGLAIGDMVMTLSGEAKPIKWIGHRTYDGRFVAGHRDVLPIRVTAGALADGVPARDLLVSPDHALYIDGVLVTARQLLNGATITQETMVEQLEYFHIELDAHDIIFASGAPAESYVDCDNRGRFHNAAEFALLYPGDDRPRWQFCAPLLQWESDEPNPIREALVRRSAALGHILDRDPDLYLVVDGAVVPPEAVDGRLYSFTLPAGAASVALASRSAVPAEVRAEARDLRRLGVPVERLVLYDADLRIESRHGHAGLKDGFHDDEPSHRWTDGLARLPESWLRSFLGAFTIEVHLISAELPYRLPPRRTPAPLRDTTDWGVDRPAAGGVNEGSAVVAT